MLKTRSEVSSKLFSLASRAGWLGYAVAWVSCILSFVFGLPWWGTLLILLPLGFLWAWLETRLVRKYLDEVYDS
jgi:membrane protein implicated in regulation of membrane protease activity